jgi:hypothetical protein
MTMKKFLSLAVLSVTGFVAVNAFNVKPEELVNFAKSIKGKTFTVDPELMRDWFRYKAMHFNLAAREFDSIADQINDSTIADRYYEVADGFRELASDLRNLQIPDQKLTKTVKHPGVMLALKAQKAGLVARHLKHMAGQISDESQKDMLLKKSKEVAQWSESLNDLLEKEFKGRVQMGAEKLKERVLNRLEGARALIVDEMKPEAEEMEVVEVEETPEN